MVIAGHVQNGVVVLDGGAALPEGAVVAISYPSPETTQPVGGSGRIEVPLVHTGQPGSIRSDRKQIAEILDEEECCFPTLTYGSALTVRFSRPSSSGEDLKFDVAVFPARHADSARVTQTGFFARALDVSRRSPASHAARRRWQRPREKYQTSLKVIGAFLRRRAGGPANRNGELFIRIRPVQIARCSDRCLT